MTASVYGKRRNIRLSSVSTWLFLLLAAGLIVYPFLYIVMNSLKTAQDIQLSSAFFPRKINFENYSIVFVRARLHMAIFNSVFITFFSILGQVLISSLAAYALTKMNFRRSQFFLTLFIIPLIFSTASMIFPIYLLLKYLNLLNSLFGLILLYSSGTSFGIYILAKFMKTISMQISESAYMDGAGHLRIYWSILMPLMKPAVATIAVLGAVGIWNDFFTPFIFFTNGKITTLPLSVFTFIRERSSQPELVSANLMFGIVPVVILYIFLQRFIINGVVTGSVKG